MGLGRQMQRVARKGEDETAKETGGRRVPGSGNGAFQKGDVKNETWLIEEKVTSAKSYSINAADVAKHRLHALREDREPVWKVGFVNGPQLAIIDWQLFLELTGQQLRR